MELIEGRALFQEINESAKMKRFDEPRYAAIMGQVFGALRYIHNNGVVHRDLKPDNIMVCQNSSSPSRPHIKIIGFGLSMEANSSEMTKGTCEAYLAPESTHGLRFTPASDM
eukprot:CAMPEP_0172933158 /NCGR_PEP_ID=MMETSP1075-20121228/220364_1 /TAXON_ID=2916 /ORGANISM="Ceratium fusus, Strain PA161109" /LENGTH=111 /DNA_ID=CAMNT_0013794495 /DNA_START=504 /DNA_END=836 /DNA_ORIENTATION=-